MRRFRSPGLQGFSKEKAITATYAAKSSPAYSIFWYETLNARRMQAVGIAAIVFFEA
jgi:hypothetical protein